MLSILANITSSQPAREAINAIDVLTQVHRFYESSMTTLLWVMGIGIGVVGILIPLVLQKVQSKTFDRVADELQRQINADRATMQGAKIVAEQTSNKVRVLAEATQRLVRTLALEQAKLSEDLMTLGTDEENDALLKQFASAIPLVQMGDWEAVDVVLDLIKGNLDQTTDPGRRHCHVIETGRELVGMIDKSKPPSSTRKRVEVIRNALEETKRD